MRELTRHITGFNDYWLLQGPFCKTVTLSSSSGLGAQEQQEGDGGPGGHGRRRLERLGARAPREKKKRRTRGPRWSSHLGRRTTVGWPAAAHRTAGGGLTRQRCSGVGPATGRG
jgi:hypothetical protein